MFGRIQRPEPDVIEVIVGPRATFSGRMQCDASIRIDGAVDSGHIETPANVILTETARVQCDITAKTVSIRGVFQGVIRADRVELQGGHAHPGLALHVREHARDDAADRAQGLEVSVVLDGHCGSPRNGNGSGWSEAGPSIGDRVAHGREPVERGRTILAAA